MNDLLETSCDPLAMSLPALPAVLSDGEITRWLVEWGLGDTEAAEASIGALYPELRRMATRTLSRWGDRQTLDTTELVNEAYAAVAEKGPVVWQSRVQFLAVVSRIMRNILVDLYRQGRSDKRGGSWIRVPIEADALAGHDRQLELRSLHEALERLEREEPEAGRIVELRFFAGMTLDECADALGLGRATVVRRCRFARAWLSQKLGGDPR